MVQLLTERLAIEQTKAPAFQEMAAVGQPSRRAARPNLGVLVSENVAKWDKLHGNDVFILLYLEMFILYFIFKETMIGVCFNV